LGVLEGRLLTPFGLRTLDPIHPDYHARYQGGQDQRDTAYHQGTVWPWLLGSYIDALVRVRGEAGKRQAGPLLASLDGHLGQAGVGSVSEIFDAEPPREPRGCIAQAWSVAELLRVCMEHGLG
ncbi:MAG: amylo-alpha-1,6-glucosidase, partial [Desulfohalobiaceae bacterium]